MGFNIQKMLPIIMLAAETASVASKVISKKTTVTAEEVDNLINSVASTLSSEAKNISHTVVKYSDTRVTDQSIQETVCKRDMDNVAAGLKTECANVNAKEGGLL